MRDFLPEAAHFPFFMPDVEVPPAPDRARPENAELTLVHVTNQPGIEGTRQIAEVIDRLRARGRRIRFHWLHDLTHQQVLAEMARADLAIGKMKMGYYANAQIESMALGVPTITSVRDEFMTDELRRSGFIFTTLGQLEETIEYYLDHPEALAAKRRIARDSIRRLHDNDRLASRLVTLYRDLMRRPAAAAAGRRVTA